MTNEYFHSVVLKEKRCIGCTACLKICPTEAIRIRDGKAIIIPERCIDCGYCIKICPNHAKTAITETLSVLKKYQYNIAIPSITVYGQFKSKYQIGELLGAIKALGFDEVYEPIYGARVICSNLSKMVYEKEKSNMPMINANCPAIVRLVQMKFPSLLPYIIEIESALEITAIKAREEVANKMNIKKEEIGITFISPCVARATSIKRPLGIYKSSVDEVVSIKEVYGEILRHLMSEKYTEIPVESAKDDINWYYSGNQGHCLGIDNYISVDGIHDVVKILEEVELGKIENITFLEAYACRGGCFGGPLTLENSFVAKARVKNMAKKLPEREITYEERQEYIDLYESGLVKFTEEILPINVTKLDENITISLEMMEKVEKLFEILPGIDCGVCGSPSCMAFAEDVIRGEKNIKCFLSQK